MNEASDKLLLLPGSSVAELSVIPACKECSHWTLKRKHKKVVRCVCVFLISAQFFFFSFFFLVVLRCGFNDAFRFPPLLSLKSLAVSLIHGNLESCYCASDEKMLFISPHVLQYFYFQ